MTICMADVVDDLYVGSTKQLAATPLATRLHNYDAAVFGDGKVVWRGGEGGGGGRWRVGECKWDGDKDRDKERERRKGVCVCEGGGVGVERDRRNPLTIHLTRDDAT